MRSRGLSLQCPKTEVRRLLRPSGAPMPQTPICAIGETDDFIYIYYRCVGGGERDRTDDLRLAKPALSQLSYAPGLCLDTFTWHPDTLLMQNVLAYFNSSSAVGGPRRT